MIQVTQNRCYTKPLKEGITKLSLKQRREELYDYLQQHIQRLEHMMAYETEKYPANIQKLFALRPPHVYKPPLDHPPEDRKTCHITGLSSWRDAYKQHCSELQNQAAKGLSETQQQQQKRRREERRKQIQESHDRQLREWNDVELLKKQEQELMKDPYKTVFLARLDYLLTELDISKHISKYGVIDSIRIIRDRDGRSRGYGFVAFERESDAKNCVKELAPTGLKIPVPGKSLTRTILVDIERGRLVRNWKPRRLGGGLGGRHYTKPNPYHSNNASAAASGRRLGFTSGPAYSSSSQLLLGYRATSRYPPARNSIEPKAATSSPSYRSEQPPVPSVRDKYAKYLDSLGSGDQYQNKSSTKIRSIRSIRER